jgi:hypothetical protein
MAFLHRPVALLLLIAPISLLVPLRTDAAAIRASTSLTIPLNVSLGNSESVNATITASNLSISNGTLTVNGSLSGTATINGTSATLSSDAFTLTAQATCNGTTGTLTLTTTPIAVALAIGLTGQLQPLTLTGTATCGSATSTLQGTTSPLTVTLSDGTVLPLSCSSCASGVTITAPSTTTLTLGNQICAIQGEICILANLLATGGSPDAAGELLKQILTNVAAVA